LQLPASAGRAKGGSLEPVVTARCRSGGLGPIRGREASCTPADQNTAARRRGQLSMLIGCSSVGDQERTAGWRDCPILCWRRSGVLPTWAPPWASSGACV